MENKFKDNTRTGAIAIVAFIVMLLIIRLLLAQWTPSGGNGGGYSIYQGPVLPMTALSGGEALNVSRHVDFDFAPYEADGTVNEVILTDTYLLTNPTAEAVTVQLAYPFEGSLIDEAVYFPAITADGADPGASLFPSVDAAQAVACAKNFDAYQTALTEQDFLLEAMAAGPEWDIPVIVYQISMLPHPGAGEADWSYLQLSYIADTEESTLWTFGLGSGEGYVSLNYPTAESPWDSGTGYLVVIGEDIQITGQQGHHTYSPGDESNRLDGMTAEITRYESTFSETIMTLAQVYSALPQYDSRFTDSAYNTPEILYTGAMKRIMDERYHIASTPNRNLDAVFHGVLSETVLMYQIFSLEIGSGETVCVEAVYHQGASRDISGTKTASDGYEMATHLGSDLRFIELSASVTNGQLIEITDQNFGFDLPNGVTQVMLDLAVGRYYLDVVARE